MARVSQFLESIVGRGRVLDFRECRSRQMFRIGRDVVDERENLGSLEIKRAIREFTAQTRNADIAVVYFAGHGIEVSGTNYLIPVDAKLANDFDAEDDWARSWLGFYRELITLRRAHIVPRLDSAQTLAATALAPTALSVSWSFGDGAVLSIAANFGPAPVDLPAAVGRRIFACRVAAADPVGTLPARRLAATT